MDMNLASPIPVQPENYLEIFMPSRNMFAHHAVPVADSPAYLPQIFSLVNRRRALGGSIALFGLVASTLYASPAAPSTAESSRPAANASPAFPTADLLLREIHYEGKLTDNQAQFTVEIDSESFDKNEAAVALFEGDVAVMPAKLPSGLRIVRAGNQYRLVASKPGKYKFKLELVARINAVLRRTQSEPDQTKLELIVVGDIEMDNRTRTVRRSDQPIELTVVEYSLLEKLLTVPGRILTREELVRDVLHRELSPFDRSIDTHVSNLRRKLGHEVNGVERIKTVRGVGYIYASPEGAEAVDR